MSNSDSAIRGRPATRYFPLLQFEILHARLKHLARQYGFTDAYDELTVCIVALQTGGAVPISLLSLHPELKHVPNRYFELAERGNRLFEFTSAVRQEVRSQVQTMLCVRGRMSAIREVLNYVAVIKENQVCRRHPLSRSVLLRDYVLAQQWQKETGSIARFSVPGVDDDAGIVLADNLTDLERVSLVEEIVAERFEPKKVEECRQNIEKTRERFAAQQEKELRELVLPQMRSPRLGAESRKCSRLQICLQGVKTKMLGSVARLAAQSETGNVEPQLTQLEQLFSEFEGMAAAADKYRKLIARRARLSTTMRECPRKRFADVLQQELDRSWVEDYAALVNYRQPSFPIV